MLLDKGICHIFSRVENAPPGDMSAPSLTLKQRCWYAELNFETTPARQTDAREDSEIALRIRVPQNRAITNRDVVLFGARVSCADDPSLTRYEIARAFHGIDDESGQPITDLTLRRVAG